MNFYDFFKDAQYMTPPSHRTYAYIRKQFSIEKQVESAKLYFSALGFAEIYLNGKKVTEDKFITPHTMYHKQLPTEFHINPNALGDAYFNDELGYTITVSEFDVKHLILNGANAFGVVLSGGWYYPGSDSMYRNYRNFGTPKTCFRIIVTYTDGTTQEIISDSECKWMDNFIIRGSVFEESIDERKEIVNFSEPDYDASNWMPGHALYTSAPESKYVLNECPPDRIIKYLTPTLIKETATEKIYALPENTTGYPVVKTLDKKANDTITVRFGEEINEDNTLEEYHIFKQVFSCITDGREEHHVRFTWYGFRYFSIATTGDLSQIDCEKVAVIYADIKNTSTFKCNIDVVNYLYDAYVLTQNENYHCGVPCDCPQIEKRGYTGDGQLIMPLGLKLFDSQKLYKKWLNDISDVQDQKTGFVHNTAPVYVSCAGGPGGWSSAIINAPVHYYKHCGDKSVLERFYPQMKKYVEFIEDEAIDSIVTIHKRKAHCLGDWSGPYKPYLPEPFANSCMFVEALYNMIETAKILGKTEDVSALEKTAERFKKAIDENYLDKSTGNYCNNEQGANAFALNIGLGDERTLKNLKDRYAEYKGFDTGIFGTKLLPKVLFDNDFGDVAMGLYTSDNEASFRKWMEWGETTLRESWFNTRSHNHPMFGSPVLWLFEYVLGIRQTEDSKAYEKVIVNPKVISDITDVSGSFMSVKGKFALAYKKDGKKIKFTVEIPAGVDAEFNYDGKAVALKAGVNKFEI